VYYGILLSFPIWIVAVLLLRVVQRSITSVAARHGLV